MDQVAALVSRGTSRQYTAVHVPADTALEQLLARGWQDAFARPFVDYMRAIADGRVAEIGDTFTTVREVTGAPALGWDAFVERNLTRFE
jgi:hypothetical protein